MDLLLLALAASERGDIDLGFPEFREDDGEAEDEDEDEDDDNVV